MKNLKIHILYHMYRYALVQRVGTPRTKRAAAFLPCRADVDYAQPRLLAA